jgi:hypothetical protein
MGGGKTRAETRMGRPRAGATRQIVPLARPIHIVIARLVRAIQFAVRWITGTSPVMTVELRLVVAG